MELCAFCFAALEEAWDGGLSIANRGRGTGGVWVSGYVPGRGRGGVRHMHNTDMVLIWFYRLTLRNMHICLGAELDRCFRLNGRNERGTQRRSIHHCGVESIIPVWHSSCCCCCCCCCCCRPQHQRQSVLPVHRPDPLVGRKACCVWTGEADT
jgi:hypothetical protein